jgi:positive regulator of sigma E activity
MQEETPTGFWPIVGKIALRIDFKHVVAMIIILYCFRIFELVLFHTLPGSADKYASQIITGLIGILGTVLAFWFAASAIAKPTKPTTDNSTIIGQVDTQNIKIEEPK